MLVIGCVLFINLCLLLMDELLEGLVLWIVEEFVEMCWMFVVEGVGLLFVE